MKPRILSDITLQKDAPKALRFSVVFIDIMGNTTEFIFYDSSVQQCVIKCTALVNYMLRYGGMSVVYIFPTNDVTVLRSVYSKVVGLKGGYKLIECPVNRQLSLEFVRDKVLNS